MITPTHVVINVGLSRWGKDHPFFADRTRRRLFILGGLAPDVGLYALTVGATAYFVTVRGSSVGESLTLIFDDLFFTEPVFVIAHNLLHAPLMILGLYVAGTAWSRRGRARLGGGLKAFALGCAVHTALDIPVHHNDGPLLAFPFNWSLRFNSPVSYYDPAYYGNIIAPLDILITMAGGATILTVWLMRKRRERVAASRSV